MRYLVIDIQLPRDEYLRVYQGSARQVRAIARNGQSVRFPVSVLQAFVGHEGVRGTFRLQFDDNNKFHAIEKLS